jgi:biopolymer transport protein ExbD
MKLRHALARLADKVDLNMTPMIDIVFLLMAFFIMTLKIVSLEGDFDIKMPRGASAGPAPLIAIPVRLTADPQGALSGIRIGDRDLADFDELRAAVRDLLGGSQPGGGPSGDDADVEIEIDADPTLRYAYTIEAVTAVTDYIGPDRRVVPLARKIKFTPPRGP